MSKYIVEGGIPLKGTVAVSGSKNATLPLLCATLLTEQSVTLNNVPNIEDVHTMISIMESIGSKIYWIDKHSITINNRNLSDIPVTHEKACKLRASILMLGSLLGRFNKVSIPYPGGCILGKRSIYSHIAALEKLGAKGKFSNDKIELRATHLRGRKIVMSELSVTATENAIMAAVLSKGTTEIRMAAAEPHVEDLCKFLNTLGANISGGGTHNIHIEGVVKLHGGKYAVTYDYLEAGTLILAAIITKGTVSIRNVPIDQLDAFFNKLDEIGVAYRIEDSTVYIHPSKMLNPPSRVESRTYPGFPTDLQAPFAVLLTQCAGVSKIFETLFEGRLNYLFELEKMGAKIEILNPHQALMIGPSKLRGVSVSSLDIRAGAAMVLAALIARGTTEINNVVYIDRGYENLEGKLKKLGAKIKRIE